MIELSSSVKKRPVEMLLDSGAIGNLIAGAMAIALKLQAQDDEVFHELTLADGTVLLIVWYV